MTPEVMLMYATLITAVLQNIDVDTFTTVAVLTLFCGAAFVIRSSNSCVSQPENLPSIWEDVIRSVPSDWMCNCVYSLLVPVAVILSTVTKTQYEGQSDYGAFLQSLALAEAVAAAIIIWLQTSSGDSCRKLQLRKLQQHKAAWTTLVYTAPVVLVFLVANNYIFSLGLASIFVQCVAVLVQCVLQSYLPLWCPRTFTFAEVAILSQAGAQYIGCTICNIMQKYRLIFSDTTTPSSVCDTNYYMEIALLCCILMVSLAFAVPWCRSVFGFYVSFALVMGFIAVPGLHLLLGDNFVHWTLNYVTENTWKKKMFIYWLECCTVGVLIVLVGSGAITELLQAFLTVIGSRVKFTSDASHKTAPSSPVSGHNRKTKTGKRMRQVSTRIRKLFHILAVAIFVPGAMKEPVMTCVAGTCCLIVFIMMEMMRLNQIPPLFQPLQHTFVLFLDEQDQGPVILTHIYLLVGCVLPMWLYPIESAPKSITLYAGVISLGIGDTVAAVVGSLIGKYHWKDSRRTKEGTIAGVIGQFLFIGLLYSWGAFVTPRSWIKVAIAVVLTSLTEAHTSHVDNLILPLAMYILLI